MCLFNTLESAQLTLDKLAGAVPPFGVCFALSKCKVMYWDWDSPEPPLTLNGIRLAVVGCFAYPGVCLNNDGDIGSEINARISKARVFYANLLHLYHGGNVTFLVKGRVYNATVCFVLLFR